MKLKTIDRKFANEVLNVWSSHFTKELCYSILKYTGPNFCAPIHNNCLEICFSNPFQKWNVWSSDLVLYIQPFRLLRRKLIVFNSKFSLLGIFTRRSSNLMNIACLKSVTDYIPPTVTTFPQNVKNSLQS